MKELNRTDRLTIAALAFAAILVIGLVTLKKPEVEFKRSLDETVNKIISSEDVILPEAVNVIVNQSDDKFFLADVRSPVEYQKSHIGQAVNIPIQEILKHDNLETFSRLAKDGVTIILYGKDQLEANGAWMILKQTGYDNIRVMIGGYDFYTIPGYQEEKPIVDFKAVLKSQGASDISTLAETPEPVKVIKREKKSAAEGGC